MNYNTQVLLWTILFTVLSSNLFGQSKSSFSQNEVLEDLDVLYASLKSSHFNLFAYTSEQQMDSIYEEVASSMNKDSLALLECTSLFQRFTSSVKNGHTEIDFPVQSYREYAERNGTLFPLEIAFEQNKALVRKNWSDNDEIVISSEILSINGKSISEILTKIHPQLSAERTYLKNTKLELYSFPRLYWQVFGEQQLFEVEIVSNGEIRNYVLRPVNLIEGYEMKRDEILNSKMTLKFFEWSAYLNPGPLSGDQQIFEQFIDSAFASILKQKKKFLIIDLRNNPGGDDSFGDYLVSYIADRPFKWSSRFSLKTSQLLKDHTRNHNDTADVFFQELLKRNNGEVYDFDFGEHDPMPKEKRFLDTVYVLINRQSHSQSAVTAAQIQDYGFGIIVGEETAEYPSLYASQFNFSLPNTGILVKVAKGRIVRVSGDTKTRGVIPDIWCKDHLLDQNDEILQNVLDLIGDVK